tara:strand:- start:377 stop:688 length:312 start_codon:yes stop_codon:yes gene_type:complete
MDQWIAIAERFGLPVIMLLGMSYGGVQLFKWLANDLMRQLQENATRIEGIVIKLIDNSKIERADNKEMQRLFIEDAKARDKQQTTLIDVMVKLTGNGLGKNGR